MPGSTSVLQTFVHVRDSWIDRIGDNGCVTDDSPGINHIVSGFRVCAVQACASEILANDVSVIILRRVSPELLYESKALFLAHDRDSDNVGSYTSLEYQYQAAVAFSTIQLVFPFAFFTIR